MSGSIGVQGLQRGATPRPALGVLSALACQYPLRDASALQCVSESTGRFSGFCVTPQRRVYSAIHLPTLWADSLVSLKELI